MIKLIGHRGRGGAAIGLVLALALSGGTAARAQGNQATQPTGTITVSVHQGAPAGGAGAAGSESALDQMGVLHSPGVPFGARVTVVNLNTGKSLTSNDWTGANGRLELSGVPAGTYEVQVERGGRTGVDYVSVGDGDQVSSGFVLEGLPKTAVVRAGPKGIQKLQDSAVAAHEAGDDEGYNDAMGQLNALNSQHGIAVERIEKMIEDVMDRLPPGLRTKVGKHLPDAKTPADVEAIVKAALDQLFKDTMTAAAAHRAQFGEKYTPPPEAVAAHFDLILLRSLLTGLIEKLREHESAGAATGKALKQVAHLTGNSQSSANLRRQRHLQVIDNVGRGLVTRGPPVRTMPNVPNPPVSAPTGSMPRPGGMTLSIPGGR